jgi:hypothetical protein
MASTPPVTPQPNTPPAQTSTQTAPTPQPTTQPAQPTQPSAGQDTNAPEPGGATAPASTLRPSTSSGVHGVLAHIALGALAGAVTGIRKAAEAPGKAYGSYINSTPYGQKVKADELELQQAKQKMQQQATEAMDEHQIKQLAIQSTSLDNLHKIAENRHVEALYPLQEEEARNTLLGQHRTQDEADRAFATHLQEAGINIEHKPFSQFTPGDGQAVGNGQKTVINNGLTGNQAGGGFISNNELENTILPHDMQVVTDWTMDDKGNMTPVYQTLKAGENTAMDALLAHDAGMDRFNQQQDMYQKQLKGQQEAATTLKTQKEAAFGPMPKSLSDATALFTRASEAYKQNPTDANKQVLDNAQEMRQNFFSDEAEKARLDELAKEGDPTPVAQDLADGILAPSQLPGRFRPEYIGRIYAMAQQLARTQGKEFNPAKLEAEYQYAKSPQTQNTLNMISAITAPGGSLDIARSAALDLPALDQKTANKVFNATATEFGSPEATRFHTAMLGLADEYAKVMGGGTATDSGRQQGLDILKQDFSRGQLNAGIDTILADVHARGRAIVGKNPALNAMYPDFTAQNPSPNPGGPTIGEVRTINGQLAHWDGQGWLPGAK